MIYSERKMKGHLHALCQIGNHFMEELEFHRKCGSVLEDSIEDEYI